MGQTASPTQSGWTSGGIHAETYSLEKNQGVYSSESTRSQQASVPFQHPALLHHALRSFCAGRLSSGLKRFFLLLNPQFAPKPHNLRRRDDARAVRGPRGRAFQNGAYRRGAFQAYATPTA